MPQINMRFLDLTNPGEAEKNLPLKAILRIIKEATGRDIVVRDLQMLESVASLVKLVRWPDPMGFGFVAAEQIKKGTKLFHYAGSQAEVILCPSAQKANALTLSYGGGIYDVHVGDDNGKVFLVRADKTGDFASLLPHLPDLDQLKEFGFNESLIASVQTQNIEYIKMRLRDRVDLLAVASEDILPGAVIGWNYGMNYWNAARAPFSFFKKNEMELLPLPLQSCGRPPLAKIRVPGSSIENTPIEVDLNRFVAFLRKINELFMKLKNDNSFPLPAPGVLTKVAASAQLMLGNNVPGLVSSDFFEFLDSGDFRVMFKDAKSGILFGLSSNDFTKVIEQISRKKEGADGDYELYSFLCYFDACNFKDVKAPHWRDCISSSTSQPHSMNVKKALMSSPDEESSDSEFEESTGKQAQHPKQKTTQSNSKEQKKSAQQEQKKINLQNEHQTAMTIIEDAEQYYLQQKQSRQYHAIKWNTLKKKLEEAIKAHAKFLAKTGQVKQEKGLFELMQSMHEKLESVKSIYADIVKLKFQVHCSSLSEKIENAKTEQLADCQNELKAIEKNWSQYKVFDSEELSEVLNNLRLELEKKINETQEESSQLNVDSVVAADLVVEEQRSQSVNDDDQPQVSDQPRVDPMHVQLATLVQYSVVSLNEKIQTATTDQALSWCRNDIAALSQIMVHMSEMINNLRSEVEKKAKDIQEQAVPLHSSHSTDLDESVSPPPSAQLPLSSERGREPGLFCYNPYAPFNENVNVSCSRLPQP